MTPRSADPHTVWLDRGWWLMPDGTRRLLSWNAASHDLRLWANHPAERDLVLAGEIRTEEAAVALMDGYDDVCDTYEGLAWLADRLRRAGYDAGADLVACEIRRYE